jgi:hypothetical protein
MTEDITSSGDDNASDPKDEQITNQDNSVTNADPDTDTEKGEQENEQKEPDNVRVPTVTPDNDSGDPGPPAEEPAVDKGETKPGKQV